MPNCFADPLTAILSLLALLSLALLGVSRRAPLSPGLAIAVFSAFATVGAVTRVLLTVVHDVGIAAAAGPQLTVTDFTLCGAAILAVLIAGWEHLRPQALSLLSSVARTAESMAAALCGVASHWRDRAASGSCRQRSAPLHPPPATAGTDAADCR